MIGFVISTIAFSLAAYALNRYLAAQAIEHTRSHKMLVLAVATCVSIAAGWVTDKVDGDADVPHKSVAEVVQSGDPLQMAKLLAGVGN
ncbi:hypothetical protein GALL_327080 [mine drainage metagenome]|uniref:Uncharacterized protein n=1 Tax=mine drainage metagenome TaxID=410659 RepID=A0A1J5R6V9_9ZZZZ